MKPLLITLACLLFGAAGFAQSDSQTAPGDSAKPAPRAPGRRNDSSGTDPSYRLGYGDEIAIMVQGEADLSRSEYIDHDGTIRLPLIEHVPVAGLTAREAAALIEKELRDGEFLLKPVVFVTVTNYAVREVSVNGAVRTPGVLQFPKQVTTMDIAEVIGRVGGFLPTAKITEVSVTRRRRDGKEEVISVNVQKLLTPNGKSEGTREQFPIYPGDRISVAEKIF